MAIDAGIFDAKRIGKRVVIHLGFHAAGWVMTLPVGRPSRCSSDAIHGLLSGRDACVTMRVSDNDPACGKQLWLQKGVIPFTRLEQVKEPEHGDLTLNDPTRFAYHSEQDHTWPNSFDLVAFGNNRRESEGTGRLHVTTSTYPHR